MPPHASESNEAPTEGDSSAHAGPYLRFAAMIGTSTTAMYALTYANLFSLEHARWSEERAYMVLIMGSCMTVVMLGFMWKMYRRTWVNLAIMAGALIVGVAAFTLSETQALIGDEAYMKGMIPHHSIAILTSERADIEDVRVRRLADGISRTQVEEIMEMDWLLDDIAHGGPATTERSAAARPVPDFTEQAKRYLRR